LQFNAGAPAYTFNVTSTSSVPSSLIISGSGVADISGNAPTFVVSGVSSALARLQFTNGSTADDSIIITNAFGQTIFSYGPTSNGALDYRLLASEVAQMSEPPVAPQAPQAEEQPKEPPKVEVTIGPAVEARSKSIPKKEAKGADAAA
jgi:hypothetical protein